MNERLKELRKALKLSQEEFGRRLGVSNTAISKLENGENNVTEQMAKLVSAEFNVRLVWINEGVGDMFKEDDDSVVALVDRVLAGENEFTRALFRAFAKFDTKDWQDLERLLDKIVATREECKKKEANP